MGSAQSTSPSDTASTTIPPVVRQRPPPAPTYATNRPRKSSLPECMKARSVDRREECAEINNVTPSLNSMKCSSCGQQDRVNIFKDNCSAGICHNHGSFVCSRCRCRGSFLRYSHCPLQCTTQLTAAIFLSTVKSRDEMKLLNFGKWNPFKCGECNTKFAENTGEGCKRCRRYALSIHRYAKLSARYIYIIDELRNLFSDAAPVLNVNKTLTDQHIGKIKAFLNCSICNRAETDMFLPKSGHLTCKACCRRNEIEAVPFPDHLSYIVLLLPHIFPDFDDLKLLTYEKWTPFRCDDCSTPFSENELPVYNPCNETISCNKCSLKGLRDSDAPPPVPVNFLLDMMNVLKGFFKHEAETHDAASDAIALNPANTQSGSGGQTTSQRPVQLISRSLWRMKVEDVSPHYESEKPHDTSSPARKEATKEDAQDGLSQSVSRTQVKTCEELLIERRTRRMPRLQAKVHFPRKLSCLCGEEEKIEDMYKCERCPQIDFGFRSTSVQERKLLLCPRCFMRYHIEHGKLARMQAELIKECVEKERTNTMAKATQLSSRLNDLHVQMEAARRELSERLIQAHSKATASELNIDEIEQILHKCDISSLPEPVKYLTKTRKGLTRKVKKRAERLEGKLQRL